MFFLCINGNKEFMVGIDTRITSELKMEGVVRDLIRHVQNFRKDSNLEVEDRIIFSIKCPSQIWDALIKFEDYFKNETLAHSISADFSNMDYHTSFNIDSHDVEIAISKN